MADEIANVQNRASGTATRSALLGAMFLMATSAIGPGFITQTTTFTAQLGAAFAFAILVSILVDIAIQQNVWRVLGVSGMRANELANTTVRGLGWVLAALVVLGGMVFNIGNISGTGLGLQAALGGLDPRIGAAISSVLAVGIFLTKRAGPVVDKVVVFLGLVMIVMTAVVAVVTRPPLVEVAVNTVLPSQIDVLTITTLIGGTVGGYITYSGAHRLIDSGNTGPEHARQIGRSALTGILVTAVMRVLLFLAIFGVVAAGFTLDPANPAASAFEAALGSVGRVVFGIIFWAAAITSVIGASFTSVTFITTQQTSERTRNLLTVAFIALGLLLYLVLGQAPVTLLIFAGAFNGVILPLGFTIILWVAWRRRDLLQGYAYPRWLLIIGVLAWLVTLYLGVSSLGGLTRLWA